MASNYSWKENAEYANKKKQKPGWIPQSKCSYCGHNLWMIENCEKCNNSRKVTYRKTKHANRVFGCACIIHCGHCFDADSFDYSKDS